MPLEKFCHKSLLKPKYLICPGYVISKNDGQRHYIGATKLLRLYGIDQLNTLEYEIYDPETWWPESEYKRAEERNSGMIKLLPQPDGKYELPKAINWKTGKPPANGRYMVQDYSIHCDCCWIDATWKKDHFRRSVNGCWQLVVVTRWAII